MASAGRCVGLLALLHGCRGAKEASEALGGCAGGGLCQAEAERGSSLLQRAAAMSPSSAAAEEEPLTLEEMASSLAAEAGAGKTAGNSTAGYPPGWPFLHHCLNPEAPGGFLSKTLPKCEAGRTPDFTRSSKIAVVGGGPGGVSMARLLSDRGFKSVKLIEMSDRLGGKSKRYEKKGETHELGTCYTAGKYECIGAWAKMVGVTQVMVDQPRLVSSPAMGVNAPHFTDIFKWMAFDTYKNFGIPPGEFEAKFRAELQAYPKHWMAAMGTTKHMFSVHGRQNRQALSQNFKDWLVERDLKAIISFMTTAMAGQGYGSPEQVTAFHGLTWMHPNLLLGGSSKFGFFQEGYQTLWERLMESSNVDVSLNNEIAKIRRLEDGKVIIRYQDGSRETFDFLIMAAPMPQSLQLLRKPKEEEKELFGSYVYRQLVATILKIKTTGSLPSDFQLFSWPDRMDAQSDNYREFLEKRNLKRELLNMDGDERPFTVRHTSNLKGLDKDAVCIFQIAAPDTSDDELTELIMADTKEYGMKLKKVLARERWEYRPSFTEKDIRDERPWKIWDMQGKRNTWWVGSYVSFESVADIVDYNFQLINARLCDP